MSIDRKQKIILISGWKGSGKDTVANYLSRKHGYVPLSIAASLKQRTAETYGLPLSYFHNQEMKEKPLMQFPVESYVDTTTRLLYEWLLPEFRTREGGQHYWGNYTDYSLRLGKEPIYFTPRALLLLEGGMKRTVDPLWWVKQVTNILEVDTLNDYVIPDVRFRNEIKYIQEMLPHAITLRITRPSILLNTGDATERDLDFYQFTSIIENSGTLEQLYRKVDIVAGNN